MASNITIFQHGGQNALVLPAKLSSFDTLKSWLAAIAKELNLTEKTKNHLFVAADEVITNIVNYAYNDDLKKDKAEMTLEISFDHSAQMLILKFFDSGVAFDPLNAQEPDILANLDDRTVGGLGIFLVKKIMDSVEYHYEHEQNVLILKKIVDFITDDPSRIEP